MKLALMAGDELVHELEYSKPGSAPASVLYDGQLWAQMILQEKDAAPVVYTLEPVLDAGTGDWVSSVVPEDQAEAVREAANRRIVELEQVNASLQSAKVRMLVDAVIDRAKKKTPPAARAPRAEWWKHSSRYGRTHEQALAAARAYIAMYNRESTMTDIGDAEVCAFEQAIDGLEDQIAELTARVSTAEAALGDTEAIEWERAEAATARAAELERMNLTLAGVVDDLKKQRAEHEAATVTVQKVFAAQREELRAAQAKVLELEKPRAEIDHESRAELKVKLERERCAAIANDAAIVLRARGKSEGLDVAMAIRGQIEAGR